MAQSPVPKATRLVKKAGLGAWLTALAADNNVMAPVTVDGKPLFRWIGAGEVGQLDLAAAHTVNSPKGGVMPQTEPMLAYSLTMDGSGGQTLDIKPAAEDRPVVLFGVRPCDAAAIDLVDKVYLTGEFTDEQYKARRDRTTVVAIACAVPTKACFCTSFDLNPGAARGADVVLYGRSGPGSVAEGDAYYAIAYTERGEAFLGGAAAKAAGVSDLPAGEGDMLGKIVAAFRGLATPLGGKLGKVDVADKLESLFESAYWEKVSSRCLSCATCTFVCPTCYCFGVADTGAGGQGVRFRYWDFCKSPQFMLMAGGHDPRPSKKNRTRQRFLHKLNYHHNRCGEYLCVGCGRCVESCPVGLHLPLVVSDVRGLRP